jgi:hypothetical protein
MQPTGLHLPQPLHHPWRAFRDLVDWHLRWGGLPEGTMGTTCFRTRTVTLAEGMSQAERRCTIAHETEHILRGPVPAQGMLREELEIDRAVSRQLIPDLAKVADAMAWARGNIEATADELWVDDYLLAARLSALRPDERAYMTARMDEVML